MGFKSTIAKAFVSLFNLNELFSGYGYQTDSGEIIGPESVKRIFAVYACTNVLAESLATLPLKVYHRDEDDNRQVVSDHPLAKVLKKPNPTMSTFDFFEHMMWSLVLRGRYFAVKVRVFGKIKALHPVMDPDSVGVYKTDTQRYQFTIGGKTYDQDDVLFIMTHGGTSVIKYQADTFGKALAVDRYGSSFFKNGAKPAVAIKVPKKLDDAAHDRMIKRWNDTYGGSGNSHKTAILDDGKEITPIPISNEDSQFLETMKYSDSQIAGLFRVPVYMIGNYDKATFSNIENLGLQFSRFTMVPWCKRIELAIRNQLIDEHDYYCEFLMDSLERGNLLSRYQAYKVGRTAGFLSPNEIRKKENMDPYEGGDEYTRLPGNEVIGGKE